MKLLVFEGADREPKIVMTMLALFPELETKRDLYLCSFGTDLRTLYKRIVELEKDGGEADIVKILKLLHKDNEENDIHKIKRSDKVSDIYLFFDYEPQATTNSKDPISIEAYHRLLKDLFLRFNGANGRGKLYISYPMVEALFDKDERFSICRDNLEKSGKGYKSDVLDKWGLYNHIVCPFDEPTEDNPRGIRRSELSTVRPNWSTLCELHLYRAGYICQGKSGIPKDLDNIAQDKIFEKQEVFALGKDKYVYVLSPFPLFLIEFLGIQKIRQILGLS